MLENLKMEDIQKVKFYDEYKSIINPKIKSAEATKPMWRRLFWTTPRNSDKYKQVCIDIFSTHFPDLFKKIEKDFTAKDESIGL